MSVTFRQVRRRRNTPLDVWNRIDKRGPDECWPFTGARSSKGYGQMRVNGAQFPAHRLAYETATGTAPGELAVLHRCDNPPCCNPAHLFLGTLGDNNRDAAAKGRSARGSHHQAAKITEDEVREIRARHEAGEHGNALAAEFGITPQAVSYIVRRETWRHV